MRHTYYGKRDEEREGTTRKLWEKPQMKSLAKKHGEKERVIIEGDSRALNLRGRKSENGGYHESYKHEESTVRMEPHLGKNTEKRPESEAEEGDMN